MSILPEPTRFTEKEYLALEEASDTRHEYVDGFIFAMAGAQEPHILIAGNLNFSIRSQIAERSCVVYGADLRVRIEQTRNYYDPDLTVVCGERKLAADISTATLLNPTVVIEILPTSTESYDRITKFADYQQMPGLQAYILVTQTYPLGERYLRGENDSWTLTKSAGLDSVMIVPPIDVTLVLADVYERIALEDDA